MNLKKSIIAGALSISIIAGTPVFASAQNILYKVQPGDTFWKISQKYGISTTQLIEANNANQNTVIYPGQTLVIPLSGQTVHTVKPGESYWSISKSYGVDFNKLLSANNATVNSMLNVGDKVIIPGSNQANDYKTYTVQKGDTYWLISQKFNVNLSQLMNLNNAGSNTYIYPGQVIKIPAGGSAATAPSQPVQETKPYVTYETYTVQKGDTSWSISQKFGIPLEELLEANNIGSSTMLSIGQKLKIPVHHIPIKSTPGEKYGELLDWWTEARYLIPIGATFEVVDFYTGKSFYVKRTTGSNHADCETLTLQDTNKMKEIWGGKLSWASRPVIIRYNGRKIAASMASYPHAGNENAPAAAWTSWRSGDYGAGINHDYVKGNGIDGHFDIHFYNSTRHKDGMPDPSHQANVKIAAGIK